MRTCFVSMPVGTKADPATGETVDFDRIYAELLSTGGGHDRHLSKLSQFHDTAGRSCDNSVLIMTKFADGASVKDRDQA